MIILKGKPGKSHSGKIGKMDVGKVGEIGKWKIGEIGEIGESREIGEIGKIGKIGEMDVGKVGELSIVKLLGEMPENAGLGGVEEEYHEAEDGERKDEHGELGGVPAEAAEGGEDETGIKLTEVGAGLLEDVDVDALDDEEGDADGDDDEEQHGPEHAQHLPHVVEVAVVQLEVHVDLVAEVALRVDNVAARIPPPGVQACQVHALHRAPAVARLHQALQQVQLQADPAEPGQFRPLLRRPQRRPQRSQVL